MWAVIYVSVWNRDTRASSVADRSLLPFHSLSMEQLNWSSLLCDPGLSLKIFTCARGTHRRPCPTLRLFGTCYWPARYDVTRCIVAAICSTFSQSVGKVSQQQSVSREIWD